MTTIPCHALSLYYSAASRPELFACPKTLYENATSVAFNAQQHCRAGVVCDVSCVPGSWRETQLAAPVTCEHLSPLPPSPRAAAGKVPTILSLIRSDAYPHTSYPDTLDLATSG